MWAINDRFCPERGSDRRNNTPSEDYVTPANPILPNSGLRVSDNGRYCPLMGGKFLHTEKSSLSLSTDAGRYYVAKCAVQIDERSSCSFSAFRKRTRAEVDTPKISWNMRIFDASTIYRKCKNEQNEQLIKATILFTGRKNVWICW